MQNKQYAVRTRDMDFLIPSTQNLDRNVDVPALLKDLASALAVLELLEAKGEISLVRKMLAALRPPFIISRTPYLPPLLSPRRRGQHRAVLGRLR